MDKLQRTVTVEQCKVYGEPLSYIVRQTVNVTSPHINAELTEAEIQALIDGGTKVTVKRMA